MLARPTKENEDEANERCYRECERCEYACYTACLYHLCNLGLPFQLRWAREAGIWNWEDKFLHCGRMRALVMIPANECWKTRVVGTREARRRGGRA
jgi:hypothetical protein